jgi:CheY-like chemotaxis protein
MSLRPVRSPKTIHRLLILDDDEIMRELLHMLLSHEGYEVTLATSGETALRALKDSSAFDLVLTDLHMPGLEGQELAKALRSAMSKQTLLFGMSGTAAAPEILADLDAFLPKPFEIQLFWDAIEAASAPKVRAEELAQVTDAAHFEPSQNMITPLDSKIFHSLTKMVSAAQLSQLFAMALADIAKRHERIEAAAAAGDLDSAQREAHAIKGSCGMIGAAEIQALAASIEEAPTLNTSAVAEIPAACLRLKHVLETKFQAV